MAKRHWHFVKKAFVIVNTKLTTYKICRSSRTKAHMRDVHRVLDKLQEAGFTLRGSKCFFGKQSIYQVGFEYSQCGVGPTKEKHELSYILECPPRPPQKK